MDAVYRARGYCERMVNPENSATTRTPDGQIGIVLKWPVGHGNKFVVVHDGAQAEHIPVIPVLLPDGEVRFYSQKHTNPRDIAAVAAAIEELDDGPH